MFTGRCKQEEELDLNEWDQLFPGVFFANRRIPWGIAPLGLFVSPFPRRVKKETWKNDLV